MSAASRVAGKVHKWLALLMAIQILFWFVSGLFFAIAPIDQVRSEHMVAEQPAVPISMADAAVGLQRIQAVGAQPAEKVEVRTLLGQPVAVLSSTGARPRLYNLATGQLLSPIPAALATTIAETDHAGDQRAARIALVEEESPEYRGSLPAWRVDFDDGASRSLYVAADTGVVGARRSTLWRTFDFLVVTPHHGLQEPRELQHAAADCCDEPRACRHHHRDRSVPGPVGLLFLAP